MREVTFGRVLSDKLPSSTPTDQPAPRRRRRCQRDGRRDALPPVLDRPPRLDVVRCYFDPDGSFPNHQPNPLLPENREFIVDKVRARQRISASPTTAMRTAASSWTTWGVRSRRFRHRAARGGRSRARAPGAKVIYDVRASWACPRRSNAPAASPRQSGLGTRSSSSACARRALCSPGSLGALLLSGVRTGRTGVVPFLLMLDLLSRRSQSFPSSRALSRAFLLTGEINTPVADAAQAARAQGALLGRGCSIVPPRRNLDRLRRLAFQRPTVEHGAAPAPEPRGALGTAHGREAGRGSHAYPRVGSRCERCPRTWPCHRSLAAVQVLRSRASLVLRHGRSRGRLLRALPPLLRSRPHRIPPACCELPGRASRVRDAGARGPVPCSRPLRRPTRMLRTNWPDRDVERDVRVRGIPAPGRAPDGHGHSDARPCRSRNATACACPRRAASCCSSLRGCGSRRSEHACSRRWAGS